MTKTLTPSLLSLPRERGSGLACDKRGMDVVGRAGGAALADASLIRTHPDVAVVLELVEGAVEVEGEAELAAGATLGK